MSFFFFFSIFLFFSKNRRFSLFLQWFRKIQIIRSSRTQRQLRTRVTLHRALASTITTQTYVGRVFVPGSVAQVPHLPWHLCLVGNRPSSHDAANSRTHRRHSELSPHITAAMPSRITTITRTRTTNSGHISPALTRPCQLPVAWPDMR